MSEKLYPDARVIDGGEVVDYVTGDPLPNYEGLVYANMSGYGYILYTWLDGERRFDVVHAGGMLLLTEVDKFLAKRKRETSK